MATKTCRSYRQWSHERKKFVLSNFNHPFVPYQLLCNEIRMPYSSLDLKIDALLVLVLVLCAVCRLWYVFLPSSFPNLSLTPSFFFSSNFLCSHSCVRSIGCRLWYVFLPSSFPNLSLTPSFFFSSNFLCSHSCVRSIGCRLWYVFLPSSFPNLSLTPSFFFSSNFLCSHSCVHSIGFLRIHLLLPG
jgi:hypothetical protein